MTRHTLNLIAGDWTAGTSEIENRNPSDVSDLIGALRRPRGTSWTRPWSGSGRRPNGPRTGSNVNTMCLMAIGTEMMARAEELGTLLSREEGKPLAEGKGEVYRAGQFFTYYAAETLRQMGEAADSVRDGIEIDVRREAVGVVGDHLPVEFPDRHRRHGRSRPPFVMATRWCGNRPMLTPASAVALVEIIARQDIPKGLVSLVMGAGSEMGKRLVESPKSRMRSALPARSPWARASPPRHPEPDARADGDGVKNALAVMDDADLDLAVTLALGGAFGGSGQKCTASSRLVVHEAVHDRLCGKAGCGGQGDEGGPRAGRRHADGAGGRLSSS